MTLVRRRATLADEEGAGKPSRTTTGVEKPRRRSTATGRTIRVKVRLRGHEMEALRQTMRTLNLSTTSDALREGLRLLNREAAELEAESSSSGGASLSIDE